MTINFDEKSPILRKAVKGYELRTGMTFDLEHFARMSVEEMGTESEKDLEMFLKSREGKSSNLSGFRAVFVKHLDSTRRISILFEKAAASMVAVFPPAVPVGILISAANRVLQAFIIVHTEYDSIAEFYNKLSRFLDQLTVIEGKSPTDGSFEKAVACIFACQLDVLGIAHEYTETKHGLFRTRQTRHFLSALWNGKENSTLKKAFDAMDSAVKHLGELIKFETFGVTKRLGEDFKMLDKKIDRNHEDIKSDHSEFFVQVRGVRNDLAAILVHVKGNTKRPPSDSTKMKSDRNIKADARDKALHARTAIRKAFDNSTRFSEWGKALAQQYAEKDDRSGDFVEDTCSGLFSQPHFERWIEEDEQFLWIVAEEGMGKSFMAHAIIDHLEKMSTLEKSSITWFFFKEDSGNVQSVDNALACAVWQIAESDSKYCQKVGQELKRIGNLDDDVSVWDRLIAKNYPPGGDERLILILDGLDEAPAEQINSLFQMLFQIPKERLKIKVLLTRRPTFTPPCDLDTCARIDVTRDLISADIERLIKARCESLPQLSKFSRRTKKGILRRITARADGLLYVEHMPRRLSYIGRQNAALGDLRDIPENLQSLYRRMTTECDKHRSKEQHDALKELFAWITYSKRPLRLAEAGGIVVKAARSATFDIEDEIRGRLGRLLELRRNYDDDEYDDDIDETDDTFNDLDIDIFEDNSHVLTFQERSLRDFFRTADPGENELRTPAPAAHLKIFLLSTSVIIEARNSDVTDPLLSYATQFWSQHFTEIDIEQLSDNDFHMVLVNLHQILTNTGNIASVFEKYADPEQIYPTPSTSDSRLWFGNLQLVIARGASLTNAILDPRVEDWVRKPQSSLEECLNLLAKGHVKNWYRSLNVEDLFKAFSFAVKAMNIPVSELDSIEEVAFRVSNTFEDIVKDAGEPRAIATVLWLFSYQDDHETAIQLLQTSLIRIQEAESSERSFTLRLLANCYGTAGQVLEAIRSIDQAISSLPQGWGGDKDLVESKCDLLAYKARIFQSESKVDEAINTYQACREISASWPELHLDGVTLDNLLDLIWDHPTTSAKFMEMVRDFTDEERKAWFGFLVEDECETSLNHLKEAVQNEGPSGFDYLIECYSNYEQSLPQGSPKRLIIQAQKAEAYRDIRGDLEMAKELFKLALYQQVRLKDVVKLEDMRSRIRRALAEVIFNEFRSSIAPEQKKVLLEEMKGLDSPGEMGSEPRESHTDVMLALMLRTLGPAVEYEEYMKKTFEICLQGLRDDVGWNDRSSFRLLAKVLACVEGLERDALIALSCQYSMIGWNAPGTEEIESDAVQESTPDYMRPNQENAGNIPIDDHQNTASPSDGSEADLADHVQSDSMCVERSTVLSPQFQGTSADLAASEEACRRTEIDPVERHMCTEDEGTDANEIDSAEDENSPSQQLEKEELSDEDLLITYDISCNGDCGFSQSKWEQPLYYCIICFDCDLCPGCYDGRVAQNHGKEANNHWRSYCGKNHSYIRGPIAGWRGVKNGYIRIVGEEDIHIDTWLTELQEIRWKEAWKGFWRRQDEVSDIGLGLNEQQPADVA